jgi:chromosome partitioning protein
MAKKIGVISQKGGVGKSTLARMLAVEFAANQWEVKIADMDTSQSTSFAWNSRRLQAEIKPEISVEQFASVEKVMKIEQAYDLLIFDGAPHSTIQTLDIAKLSDVVVVPTGTSLDDLEPTIKLCHELKKKGIEREKIFIALSRVGNSQTDIANAFEYIKLSGYNHLKNYIEEKTAYRLMNDEGKSLSETTYKSLKEKVDLVVEEIGSKLN